MKKKLFLEDFYDKSLDCIELEKGQEKIWSEQTTLSGLIFDCFFSSLSNQKLPFRLIRRMCRKGRKTNLC